MILDQWGRDGFFIVRGMVSPERVGGLVDAAIAIARKVDKQTVVVPEGNAWHAT